MPDGQGRSQSSTGIARGGLDPEIAETPLAQNPTVGDAVEGNASRQAQIFDAQFSMYSIGQAQDDFFGDALDGGRNVHVALSQPVSAFRGGPPNSESKRLLVIVSPVA